MKLNRDGPDIRFTASRGDPDIGRFKRGRAPCPSTLNTFLTKRKARVADGLDACAIEWVKALEGERNAQLPKQFSMFNDQLSMRYTDVYQLIEHCALKHCTIINVQLSMFNDQCSMINVQ